MFCDEALDAVEPIAAGEMTADGRVADHLATCPNCSSALTRAKALERALRARTVPAPPAQFTTRTMARVRRERWQTDQVVDVGFNVAVVAIVVAVVAGIWMLLNRSGLVVVSGDAATLLGSGMAAFVRRVAPSLPLYGGAIGVLATALGIWWWAERDAPVH